jgi:hypothetical protein
LRSRCVASPAFAALLTPSACSYFAPRLDLANRKLRKVGADLRRKARVEELRRRVRASSDGRVGSDEEMHGLQEELRRVRGRVSVRMEGCQSRHSWR